MVQDSFRTLAFPTYERRRPIDARGAAMDRADRPPTAYPPTEWAVNRKSAAPGPVSRQLVNYFAMCAPRSRRRTRTGEG